jgi:hypothetical protein
MLQRLSPPPKQLDGGPRPDAVITLGRALELLEYVIEETPPDGTRTCVLADCLALVGVEVAALQQLRCVSARELYANRRLPVRLTLGAAAALYVAQRSTDFGLPAMEVLSNAERVGRRVANASGDCLLTDIHPHLQESQQRVRTP